jgi:hypothetical protein
MSKIITLFIEELEHVRGGINRGGDPGNPSTLRAYEDGNGPSPFDPPSASTAAMNEEGGGGGSGWDVSSPKASEL